MNKIGKKLEKIFTYIKGKYKSDSKIADIKMLGDFVVIDVEFNNKYVIELKTIGEFYREYIRWIKELPEEHAIFMAEILGQNTIESREAYSLD